MKKSSKLLVFLGLLILWQILSIVTGQVMVPSPFMVIFILGQELVKGDILIHLAFSLYRLLTAVLLAIVFGLLSGLLMAMNKSLDRIFSPVLYLLFPLPKAALLPILFLLFGIGDGSKIVLLWLILFFQVIMSVYDAVKNIDKQYILVAETLLFSKLDLYRHVVLPAIIPDLLSTLRISIGIGIAVLFFVENYATDRGLGYYIMSHWALIDYPRMYAGILLLSLMGYLLFLLVDYLKINLVKWQ